MTAQEQQALLRLTLRAAYAGSGQDSAAREQIRYSAERMEALTGYRGLVPDVLLERVSLWTDAACLAAPGLRQLAFELAVGACNAGGLRIDTQTRFLIALGRALGLTAPAMAGPAAEADALATLPLTGPKRAAQATAGCDLQAAVDTMVLKYAIANGALQRLPLALASLATLALQQRMIYQVGAVYGCAPTREQARDFLRDAGFSPLQQYLEDIGRKFALGLFHEPRNGWVGGSTAAITGGAFAKTHALGHLAERYYAGGCAMSPPMLQAELVVLDEHARALQPLYESQIEQQARQIDREALLAWTQNQ
ncbi:MAG: GTPase [Burkholderiaceae bacterium]|nr:GTPase [Burkholderiaceae bacterium]